MTYPVQKVDKPCYIITMDMSRPYAILYSIKDVANLIVKIGRRALEVEEPIRGLRLTEDIANASYDRCSPIDEQGVRCR